MQFASMQTIQKNAQTILSKAEHNQASGRQLSQADSSRTGIYLFDRRALSALLRLEALPLSGGLSLSASAKACATRAIIWHLLKDQEGLSARPASDKKMAQAT